MTEGHEIFLFILTSLAALIGGAATLILSWLRSDIKDLSEKISSLRDCLDDLKTNYEHTHGILAGKGILDPAGWHEHRRSQDEDAEPPE
jgi:hypothetical protein